MREEIMKTLMALVLIVLIAGMVMASEFIIKDQTGAVINRYTVGDIEVTVDNGTIVPEPEPVVLPIEPPGMITLKNNVSVQFVKINARATKYYKIIVPRNFTSMRVSMGTNDWRTNQDLMMSYGLPYPTVDDYITGKYYVISGPPMWAAIFPGSSNEGIRVRGGVQAGTYYLMVTNTSNNIGTFELTYSVY